MNKNFLEQLYNARAAANTGKLSFKETQREDVPFYIYKENTKLPIAYVSSRSLARYFSMIEDLADYALNANDEINKLKREVSRLSKKAV